MPGTYTLSWVFLTMASVFVASINVRLPRTTTVVISMGDVFTILALMYFGSGPALVTLWTDMVTASVTDYSRRHGIHFYRQILLHRFLFNLAASPLAILSMSLLYRWAMSSNLTFPGNIALGLTLVASSWFVVNTVTLAAAVSFWSQQRFWEVWRNAISLYLLNFFGCAACAGLIFLFYRNGDIYIFIFAVPVVLLLYRLYRYHGEQYDQAQTHIEQLSRSEARYRSLVEAASDAIFSLSTDLRITSLNTAFERITGWTIDEWLGRPLVELMHADDAPKAGKILERGLHGETVLLPELRLACRSGTHVVVECTATPHSQAGQVIGLLGIARDMTERKRLEESLRQSQKMEAVGRLAGGVAHDFNNLLVVILGYADLLMGRMDTNDQARQQVDEIRKSGERAAALTRQLLAFSRKQIIHPVPLDLNAVVRSMDLMLRRVIGEDIELVNVLDRNLGVVKADPGQIEQVILNLAVNSRDAMPTGGKLQIQTMNVTSSDVSTAVKSSVPAGDYVMLAVTDNGSGIPDEIQSLVFEPFFTTKEVGRGTGLGLATVYGIVNQSGGYIALESGVGKGTTIKIFLSCIEEEVRLPDVQPSLSLMSQHETVLLVEDESAVRNLASAILRRDGYVVLEARSGEQALEISRDYAARIDALITDVVMPHMSGRQLAETIQATRRDIKVLYISGYTDDVISHHGVLEPGAAFLQKPFSPGQFARTVHELLHPSPQGNNIFD